MKMTWFCSLNSNSNLTFFFPFCFFDFLSFFSIYGGGKGGKGESIMIDNILGGLDLIFGGKIRIV